MAEKKKLYEDYSDDFYAQEGLAIFYKGKMIMGLHPENLEANLKKIDNGEVKINWSGFSDPAIPMIQIKHKK